MLAAALGFLPVLRRGLDSQRNTRDWHDRDDSHTPATKITSEQGFYGATIRQLQAAGQAIGLGARRGYRFVNLLLFCLLWPLLTAVVVLVVVRQCRWSRTLRPTHREGQLPIPAEPAVRSPRRSP